MTSGSERAAGERGEYCRRIEAYLCQKNGGHLIRLVGPAFDTVCGWADRGIPFALACQGIDRYFERHDAKPSRRRMVQIHFCEPDVLDVFDGWRRAVGVTSGGAGVVRDGDGSGPEREVSRHGSLPAHLERVIAQLTLLRGAGTIDDEHLDRVVRELDAARGSARGLRGAAREACLDRLRELDAALVASVRATRTSADLEGLRREASAELSPFRERMPAVDYARALDASLDRLVARHARLPRVAFD